MALLLPAFGGIAPNPLLSEVKKAAKEAAAFGADLIIAVGGGSVIDAAKAVCLACKYPGELWDI